MTMSTPPFVPGQPVICVDTSRAPELRWYAVYRIDTIRWLSILEVVNPGWGVTLVGVKNNVPSVEWTEEFRADRFRPMSDPDEQTKITDTTRELEHV